MKRSINCVSNPNCPPIRKDKQPDMRFKVNRESKLQEARNELQVARDELEETRYELQEDRNELQVARDELQVTRDELKEANMEADKYFSYTANAWSEIATLERNLEKLDRDYKDICKARDATQSQNIILAQSLAIANTQITELSRCLATFQVQNAQP
uniref:Uncharacterized protein n=1 Tax=Megaviridae environmental sample TaxID=1737588 RepID=A0A5J6VIS3_9VIRU|nr:MAG: hypothetical protein [Megaviridae environmental sample]